MMPSLTPGFVASYDADTRTCRVRIPGVTDGAKVYPEAEIMQALGDKSEDTEIEILVNDRVWLSFINGDPNYPVIVGFRARNQSNMVGTRHWHHENIKSDADTDQMHTAGRDYGVHATRDFAVLAERHLYIEADENLIITVGGNVTMNVTGNVTLAVIGNIISSATSWVHTGVMTIIGLLTGTGGMAISGGSGASITGDVSIDGAVDVTGDVVAAGISTSEHTHNENGDGGGVTDPPNS